MTATFANLIAANIRSGINVGGVIGTLVEGKRWVTGSGSTDQYGYAVVTNLAFKPSIVIVDALSVPQYMVAYYEGR